MQGGPPGSVVIPRQNGHSSVSSVMRREGAGVFTLQPPFKIG